MDETKVCTRCGEEKPIGDFHRNGKQGRQPRCKGCVSELMAEYYQQNAERIKQRVRLYQERRRGDGPRRRQGRDPEKRRAGYQRYREQHRDQCLARMRRYYSERPEIFRAISARRRANDHGHAIVSDLTDDQWQEILARFEHRCAYCGKESARITQDHVIPLSRGGDHTASNVLPACRSCNSRKGRLLLEEWRPDLAATLAAA